MFLIRFRAKNYLILLYHTEQNFDIGFAKIFFKRLPKTTSEIPNSEGSNLACHAWGYSYYILRSDSMATTATKTAPTGTTAPTAQSYFSRKIGNTTFVVSVSFNEKATDSMDDKILRLVSHEIGQGVEQQCG